MFKLLAVLIALQGAALGRPEEWGRKKETLGAREGVVIATMDTGAGGTHEALRDNFAGSHGWFDPSSANPTPIEDNGHGTQTIGIIAGGIIAQAPDIVPNYWADGRIAGRSDPAIEVQHLDGIIPIFSNANNSPAFAPKIIVLSTIGNKGPSSNTDNSPGDRNLIGDKIEDDQISSFPSVG